MHMTGFEIIKDDWTAAAFSKPLANMSPNITTAANDDKILACQIRIMMRDRRYLENKVSY